MAWSSKSESDDYYLCTVRDHCGADCGGVIAVGLAWSPRIEDAHHFFSKEYLELYVKGIGERYRVLEHKRREVKP